MNNASPCRLAVGETQIWPIGVWARIVCFVICGLSGCTAAPPPPPPPPVLTLEAFPTAAALRQAEARGYAAGLAAGKRIEARQDEVMLAAAIADTKTRCQMRPPPTVAAPAPPLPPAPVKQPPEPPASVYVPGGPAVPLSGGP